MKKIALILLFITNLVQAQSKIAIITSIFKGDQFIEQFLNNIMQQTVFKPGSKYPCKLYLINANSPGNEELVIQRYLERYPEQIIYTKLSADPGIYGVWNLGIKMADADYVINANLDDQLAPQALELFADALERMPEVDLVYADFYCTKKPNISFEQAAKQYKPSIVPEFTPRTLLWYNLPNNHPLWRKSLHERFGYFNEHEAIEYKSSGDWAFWLYCVSKGVQFKKVHATLGTYYVNPQGISSKSDSVGPQESAEIYKKYKPIIEAMSKR